MTRYSMHISLAAHPGVRACSVDLSPHACEVTLENKGERFVFVHDQLVMFSQRPFKCIAYSGVVPELLLTHDPSRLRFRDCCKRPFWKSNEYMLQARVVRQLDKLTGLSAAEKNLMLSWNIYLRDHPCLSDAQIGQRCIDFAAEHAKAMRADPELRRCFMVHLVNLWEFNIVTSDLVDACMVSIDAQS